MAGCRYRTTRSVNSNKKWVLLRKSAPDRQLYMGSQGFHSDAVLPEKESDHVVPSMFQRLIHGKNTVGNPGGTDKLLILIFQIQIHTGNILSRKTAVYGCDRPFQILGGEPEHKFKGRRGPFPSDYLKTYRTHQRERNIFFLRHQLIRVVLRAEKIGPGMSVQQLGHAGGNGTFRQQKAVKGICA